MDKKKIIKKACDGKGGPIEESFAKNFKYGPKADQSIRKMLDSGAIKYGPRDFDISKVTANSGRSADGLSKLGKLGVGAVAANSIYQNRKPLGQLAKGIASGTSSLLKGKGVKQSGIDAIDTFSGDGQKSSSVSDAIGLAKKKEIVQDKTRAAAERAATLKKYRSDPSVSEFDTETGKTKKGKLPEKTKITNTREITPILPKPEGEKKPAQIK